MSLVAYDGDGNDWDDYSKICECQVELNVRWSEDDFSSVFFLCLIFLILVAFLYHYILKIVFIYSMFVFAF